MQSKGDRTRKVDPRSDFTNGLPGSREGRAKGLRWFGHAARRPAGEIIREAIKPEPPAHWCKKRGG